MKRFSIFVLGVALCLFCRCGKNGASEENSGPAAGEVLAEIVKTQTEFPENLTEGSHDIDGETSEKEDWQDTFGYLYDFPADKVESYGIIYSTETTADEITVVKLKDSSDADEMKKAMEDRLSRRTKTFENYGPEEVAKLNKAVIKEKGRYLVLIISSQPSEASEAFDKAV